MVRQMCTSSPVSSLRSAQDYPNCAGVVKIKNLHRWGQGMRVAATPRVSRHGMRMDEPIERNQEGANRCHPLSYVPTSNPLPGELGWQVPIEDVLTPVSSPLFLQAPDRNSLCT